MLKSVNTHEFYTECEDLIYNQDQSAVLYFSATWCKSCNAITPHVDRIAREVDMPIYKIDVDKNPKISDSFHVTSLPCFIFFKHGEIVEQLNQAPHPDTLLQSVRFIK